MQHSGPSDYKPGVRTKEVAIDCSWAGPRARTQLYLAYLLAFLCLLRMDEVLRIRWGDISNFNRDPDGSTRFTLTLHFRKTAQSGGNVLIVPAMDCAAHAP
jgi:integrase